MTKTRSRCLFVLFAIILVLCLIATFFSFTYPFTVNGNYYSYSSFLSNVRLGEDISTSVKYVYRAEIEDEYEQKTNYDNLRNSTVNELKNILQGEGYKDSTVANYGTDKIVVKVGNLITKDDADNVDALIANPARISFSMSSETSEAFAGAKDISSVSAYDYPDNQTHTTTYYVMIRFKDKDKIADATKDGGTLYIFFGDTQFTSMSLSEGITDGYILISSEAFVDHATANSYVNRIKTGMLDLKLTQLSSEIVEGSYGSLTNLNNTKIFGALSGSIMWIALGVIMLIGFIFLIAKYKQLGWLACFNLLFFVCIGLFLLQSIPLVHINFAGMIGLILCLMLSADSLMTIFEKAKYYYNADTKLHIAFKTSQKESLLKIFIQNGLLIVAGLIAIFMPNMAIQSLGWALLVLPFVTLFASLVLMRLFIKMYLSLNSTDGKKCNFHKGGKNA